MSLKRLCVFLFKQTALRSCIPTFLNLETIKLIKTGKYFNQKSVTLPPTKNFMESIKVHDKTFVPYLKDAEIQEIVKETALRIYEDFYNFEFTP